MTVRVRFAPSPTGNVHIGNIRAAIFNWLFARHEGGEFLLRVEDTDLERSTPEAIATLLDVMAWLELDVDQEPLYQTGQRDLHLAAAQRLLDQGDAYRMAKGGGDEATLFRIPFAAEKVAGVSTVGPAEINVHPEVPVVVSASGVGFAGISRKGKATPGGGTLAGFKDLQVMDAAGTCLFALNDHLAEVLEQGASFSFEEADRLVFTRRQVAYTDAVKGELAKPLDSMKDLVIVRSDGSPIFHLANVCDDVTQGITHIIRGDDHVENTYRHIFMFAALGAEPPRYGHLPMIVNSQGKPYSKRDGDAFVGDFRDKGFLPEALFNYLTLLGWSPGDDREKMTRDELVAAFSLDRVQQSAAQVDLRKLQNLNGQYLAELPFAEFLANCRRAAADLPWFADADDATFQQVANLLQSRTKLFADVADWAYFFIETPEYDAKALRKFVAKGDTPAALTQLRERLADVDFADLAALEAAVHAVEAACEIREGKLNQPVRVAVTGCGVGAGVYDTMTILGRDRCLQRLDHALALCASADN
ncbi:MAG: glutamate--tRNA ligase [Victivallales bacterium]|nr:glutamate--tRNA ligase [Victivallales bacterium]MBT7301389.1 glutamate--tRNA ligase [Victivallales bacterium]